MKTVNCIPVFLSTLTLLSFTLLSSSSISADDSIVDNINITVPASCSLFGTGQNSHNATIVNGTYEEDIGTTTLKAFCNDAEGFAIYAAGYTGDEIGGTNSNKLVGTSASGNATIVTGLATSAGNPDVSNWAMKLATTSSPTPTYPITIDSDTNGSFSNYHIVPNEYVKVAHRDSATDIGTSAEGSTLTTTYRAYISKTQAADTYSGKVIYTLVHPSSHIAPVPVSKNLYYAITGEANNYTLTISDSDITSGAVAGGPVNVNGYSSQTTIPWYSSYATQIKSVVVDGTVAPTSTAYWFYELENCDSWDLAGLKTDNVTDMSHMFRRAGYGVTTFALDLSSWNTENVTDMNHMFYQSGLNATTFDLDLSDWNTASVTNMNGMFSLAGSNATTWSVGDLSSWNTAGVTDMSDIFTRAGYKSTTFILNLSTWDTTNVTNMQRMFYDAGRNATTWSIGDLSNWNTASVTNMNGMFSYAGRNATTWSIGDLSNWNTASVTNMNGMFFQAGYNATTFTLDLSSWNTASVTDMANLFFDAGYSATTWSVGDLSNWNTASVTNMLGMFYRAGYNATTWSVGDLSNWNTASVTNMKRTFAYAGHSATTWFVGNLSSWNTASVTDMANLFLDAGYSATTFNLDLSSWNTANVTSVEIMFYNAGHDATTWSVTIPRTNGASSDPISNTTSRFYGQTTSVYTTPPSGKSFTLAQ